MYGAPRFRFDIICPKDSFRGTQRLYLVKPADQIVSRKKFEYWIRQPGFDGGFFHLPAQWLWANHFISRILFPHL